jgi:hypothetical protein
MDDQNPRPAVNLAGSESFGGLRWKEATTRSSNRLPETRWGQALATLPNGCTYLWGGRDGQFAVKYYYFTELYSLKWVNIDSTTFQWEYIPVNSPNPPGRCFHSMCGLKDKLYLIGGQDNNNIYSELYVFSHESKKWEIFGTSGPEPGGRFSLYSAPLNAHTLLVYGGRNDNENFGDLFLLDVGTKTYK